MPYLCRRQVPGVAVARSNSRSSQGTGIATSSGPPAGAVVHRPNSLRARVLQSR
jgi:hypothetical protein